MPAEGADGIKPSTRFSRMARFDGVSEKSRTELSRQNGGTEGGGDRLEDAGVVDPDAIQSKPVHPHSRPTSTSHSSASTPKLLFCTAGVFVSFFVFGIFQERM